VSERVHFVCVCVWCGGGGAIYFSLLKYYTILHELKNNHCYIFLVRKSVAPSLLQLVLFMIKLQWRILRWVCLLLPSALHYFIELVLFFFFVIYIELHALTNSTQKLNTLSRRDSLRLYTWSWWREVDNSLILTIYNKHEYMMTDWFIQCKSGHFFLQQTASVSDMLYAMYIACYTINFIVF
jgi:hypothetical protein